MDFTLQALPNGLRLIQAPLASVHSVAVFVGVGVGWRYEDKRINGLAHFLEHMFFKGSAKRPRALDITTAIDSVGGVLQAGTLSEMTYFYTIVPQSSWEKGWDVLSDMLLNPLFREEDIAQEKGVIAEEISMYYDTPMIYVQEVFQRLLYGDHPLGWDSFGTKESTKSFKKQDFVDFYRRWYHPNATVVVFSGALGGKPLTETVTQTYAASSSAALSAPLSVPEPKPGPNLKILFKDCDQAHVVLGGPAYSVDHPLRYPAEVLAALLGGGMSSRLFTEVREKRGYAYYISASHDAYRDAGSFSVSAGLPVKKVVSALEVILAELGQVAREPVGEEELRKVKTFLEGRLSLKIEGSRGAGEFYLFGELWEGQALSAEAVTQAIEAVTSQQVQQVAKDIFRKARVNLALIGPFRDEQPLIQVLDTIL